MNKCLSTPIACESMLQWCGIAKTLLHGHCIHHYMVEMGLDLNTLLCNSLLDMYGKCRAPADAHASFTHISQPNVISWNFVIKAFAGSGKGKDALQLFHQMNEEGYMPSKFIFVTILSLCASRDTLQAGKRIHAHTIAACVCSDVVVRTALVHMYNKCCSLVDATLVFQEIPNKDTVFYNAMILAHAQHGNDNHAFYLFAEMLQAELIPNKRTFLSLLSLCSKQQALIDGKLIHSCIVHSEYDGHTDLGTALVNMYGKCSSVDNACIVFDSLLEQDLASWNSVISVCAHDEHAFRLFNNMQVRGVVPDVITFVGILSARASQGSCSKGIQMDMQMRELRFEENLILRNTLLNMYCNCGTFNEAERSFDNMPMRDVFSWNTMLAGCTKWRKFQHTLGLFYQMFQEGVIPDGVTFVTIFSLCGELGSLATGLKMHVHLLGTSYKSDVIVGTALVNMYGRCYSAENAEMVFDGMYECNIFSWNAMMAAHARKGNTNKVFHLLEKMLLEGIFADRVTFSSILSLFSKEEGLAESKRLHIRSTAVGLDTDVLVANALINSYGKCGAVGQAVEVFEKIKTRDLISWNALITAYAHNGFVQEALQVSSLMAWEGMIADNVTLSSIISACSSPEAIGKGRQLHAQIFASHFGLGVVVGNALVNMYLKCGCIEDALKAFSHMQEQNDVTFISILSVCGSQAALEEGKLLHAIVVERELEHGHVVGNALLNVYGKCSSLDDARSLFEKMQHRDVISYNIMIAAYSQTGHVQNAFTLLRQMQLTGFMPDKTTFVSVLSACSHGGLIEEGLHSLKFMKQQFNLTPSTIHYNCIIDLLGRAGLTNAAETLVSKMPVQSSVISWMALLGAFRNQVDIGGGERAAKGLLRLDAEKTAPYVVLSNIYADAGHLVATIGY